VKPVYAARPTIGMRELIAVVRVMLSKQLSQGREVAEFEREFSELVESRECVAVNSGTSALHLALLSHGIGPGDEVIVPSFTFAATANAVSLTGATPRFADVDPNTFNILLRDVSDLINRKTKAVIAVHLFGLAADMPRLEEIARKHNLLLFEDAAQSHIASIGSKLVGTYGDAACFSFYPTKNMTTGEGGMIAFKNSEPARIARLLRNQGMEERYKNEIVGFNLRMTNIAAAIGRVQLKRLKKFTRRRTEIATHYSVLKKFVDFQSVPESYRHVYHQFTIKVKYRRDDLQKFLKARGIESNVYYPVPVHQLKPFADLSHDCPNSEYLCQHLLSLPIHPKMTKGQIKKVIATVEEFFTLFSK